MPSFAVRHPYLIIVFCLFVVVLGIDQRGAHAGGHVSADQHSRRAGRHFLQRHASRSRSKRTSPIPLSDSSRWRAAWTTWNRGRCPA